MIRSCQCEVLILITTVETQTQPQSLNLSQVKDPKSLVIKKKLGSLQKNLATLQKCILQSLLLAFSKGSCSHFLGWLCIIKGDITRHFGNYCP